MSQLNVRVEELSPVVRRLDIQVPAARVAQVTEDVYRRLARTVKLKGYRQGHVPRRVLEKHFAEQVRSDVARQVVDVTFPEALASTPVSPVAPPTVEPSELRIGEDFSYSARVEVRPEVKLTNYKGLEISVTEQRVDDAAVDREIERMRESMSTLVPVEGRDVLAFGDVASISYEMDFVGTNRPVAKRDDSLVRVEAGLFIEGKGEKLNGAKVGETREFTEQFGQEDVAEELKGKTVQIKATIKGIKSRETPALDDEFAKDVGAGVETLEALKAKLRQDLEANAAETNTRNRRNALLEKLIEANPLEVPPALVDNAAARIAEDFVENLAARGLPIDAKNPMVEQFKREAQPRAMFDVKGFFLLEAVAKAESLEVTDADVDARIAKVAEEQGIDLARVKAYYARAQNRSSLVTTMRNEKALDLVGSQAKVSVTETTASENAGA